MSSVRRVPETRLMGGGELSADDAWRALRRYGGWRLLSDALVRFRHGDGFSHARALGLQRCLGAVPLLIAMNGLASRLWVGCVGVVGMSQTSYRRSFMDSRYAFGRPW